MATKGSTSTALALKTSPAIKKNKDPKCLADLGYAHLDQEDVHESQLAGMADALETLQSEFEATGQFKEAEIVRIRLEKLRAREEARLHEEFQSRQIAERLGVEEAHMQELQEFWDVWDSKDAGFEEHVTLLSQTLRERHAQAHEAYLAKIEKETEPRHPKWSKELLNLKSITERLAKQKNYVEAAKVKDDVDTLEGKEHGLWKRGRETKLASLEEQFLTKQQMEMSGLIARIEANRCEHKQAKKKELDRLLQRYHNVKTQMESQQRIKYQRANQYREVDLETASQSSRPSLIGGPRRPLDNTRASFGAAPQRPSTPGSSIASTPLPLSGGIQRPSSAAGRAANGTASMPLPQRKDAVGAAPKPDFAPPARRPSSNAGSQSASLAGSSRAPPGPAGSSAKAGAEAPKRSSLAQWK